MMRFSLHGNTAAEMFALALAFSAGCTAQPASHAQTPSTTVAAQTPARLTDAQKLSVIALNARRPRGSGAPDFGFMVTPAEYAANYADDLGL